MFCTIFLALCIRGWQRKLKEREREELKGTDKKHIYLARAESWDGGLQGLNYMHRYLPYKKPARHLP
jgi:hypothetical protein